MNLLSEPLFRCEPASLRTLPGILSGLAQGEIHAFPALRPHQRAAWHMFLVQLGVLAIERAGWPEDAEGWRSALQGLTEFGDDPWRLVVRDRSRPAFLQPSDPGGLKWLPVPTPDALDMLITSKNHDIKSQVAARALADDWIFALVTLQTMEGYGGKGNHGIARMNGGSSSRPMLALAPASEQGGIDLAGWWRRDVEQLIGFRTGRSPPVGRIGGHALLWCRPWPERRQLKVDELDPLFIEVCRRIRLLGTPRGIRAGRAMSKDARIDAKPFKGALGDPWAPVHNSENKALTLGERDFNCRLVCDLLYGDWAWPMLADPGEEERAGALVLVAEAISRGNSRTDGLKRRLIPLPRSGAWRSDNAAAAASVLIEDIGAVDTALREAIALFVARGDYGNVDKKDRLAAAGARKRFREAADRLFFPALWHQAEAGLPGDVPPSRQAFRAELVRLARQQLDEALNSLPVTHAWAPRARLRARQRFRRVLRKSEMLEENADARE